MRTPSYYTFSNRPRALLFNHGPDVEITHYRTEKEREEGGRRGQLLVLEYTENLLHRHAQHLRCVGADQEGSSKRADDPHKCKSDRNEQRFVSEGQNEAEKDSQSSGAYVLRAFDNRIRDGGQR